ncbi:glutathione S-transferase family protein [Agarivorans sp. MS3-6]|uniref:glutathione S-transferase family protein n=1 Tax=Agarivorans sp. TSD2052 TaxID=2937286 RepID=UPI00200F3D86|nr:glutathione S-transferase family protein [Agarivorans sp. TSD2052]UPW18530.1 glutathione S-transferase family protein [Agarivorans sp. TSD2052]
MILHDYLPSGNGYKIRLLLSLLGQEFQVKCYNIVAGETRTAAFLALNPNGKIPVLQFDDGRCLAESNAVLFYLAQNSAYWPQDSWQQAQVLKWMNFEQYSHEPNIASVRFWLGHAGMNDTRQAQLEDKMKQGYAALDVMEQTLNQQDFFVGEQMSIADIALYAYTHVAEEGGFELNAYPAIRKWCQRISQLDNYLAIDDESVVMH